MQQLVTIEFELEPVGEPQDSSSRQEYRAKLQPRNVADSGGLYRFYHFNDGNRWIYRTVALKSFHISGVDPKSYANRVVFVSLPNLAIETSEERHTFRVIRGKSIKMELKEFNNMAAYVNSASIRGLPPGLDVFTCSFVLEFRK